MEDNLATKCYERISLSMIPRYIGKFVTVVGHFGGFENDVLYLKVEGGRIGILGVETLEDTPLEIRGQVNDQGHVDAMEFTDLGADFDLKLYAKVEHYSQNTSIENSNQIIQPMNLYSQQARVLKPADVPKKTVEFLGTLLTGCLYSLVSWQKLLKYIEDCVDHNLQ